MSHMGDMSHTLRTHPVRSQTLYQEAGLETDRSEIEPVLEYIILVLQVVS